jgi:hypothetical protein
MKFNLTPTVLGVLAVGGLYYYFIMKPHEAKEAAKRAAANATPAPKKGMGFASATGGKRK